MCQYLLTTFWLLMRTAAISGDHALNDDDG
jgi:hypothetical protein